MLIKNGKKDKRWQGECISKNNKCNICKYLNKCITSINNKNYTDIAPRLCGIYKLRNECKGVK